MPKQRPTLAYIVNTLNAGGTEKLVVEMSLKFAAEFDVIVVCLDEPGIWAEKLREQGIPVHCLWRQPGLDLLLALRLARLLRRCNACIVHAHQCTAWFYAALARLFYARPRLLLEEHGRFYPEQDKPLKRWINKLLIGRLTHRFVAVSEDIRVRLQRYEGLDARRIEVIYNGVMPEPQLPAEARQALRAELGLTPDSFVVGTVGRFDPIKNLPMLVGSLAEARRRMANVRGLLIGDGPMRPEISALLGREGLEQSVRMPGFREDARRVIQCMDLFVLASFSEGTSIALLEAMAAGVPVAVTQVGGNPEIVHAGETGWVVPSGAVEALTEAIVESASNPARGAQYSRAGQLRFHERFAFEKMIDAYRERYLQLLGEPA